MITREVPVDKGTWPLVMVKSTPDLFMDAACIAFETRDRHKCSVPCWRLLVVGTMSSRNVGMACRPADEQHYDAYWTRDHIADSARRSARVLGADI